MLNLHPAHAKSSPWFMLKLKSGSPTPAQGKGRCHCLGAGLPSPLIGKVTTMFPGGTVPADKYCSSLCQWRVSINCKNVLQLYVKCSLALGWSYVCPGVCCDCIKSLQHASLIVKHMFHVTSQQRQSWSIAANPTYICVLKITTPMHWRFAPILSASCAANMWWDLSVTVTRCTCPTHFTFWWVSELSIEMREFLSFQVLPF